MIIGNGDIASALNDREGAIFFASGVSNSNETNERAFEREINLLREYRPLQDCLFYFSSLAIDFRKPWEHSRYFRHKIEMEKYVKLWFQHYNIIRIGNIDWGTNPNTFLNYIKFKRAHGEQVEIRDEWKYMISKEQLRLLTDNLPLTGQNTISVFGECKKVKDLV